MGSFPLYTRRENLLQPSRPGLKVCETLVAGKDVLLLFCAFFFIAFTSLLPYSFLFPCLSTGFITSLWRDDAGATMSTCITSDCEGINYLCISCCSTLSVWEHLGLFNCVSFPSFSVPFLFFFLLFITFFLSLFQFIQCPSASRSRYLW